MDKTLVCRVLVPKHKQEKKSVSTGYAIKQGVVLIAMHSLQNWNKAEAITLQWDIQNTGTESGVDFHSKTSTVLYKGEDKNDVALLEVETPHYTPLRPWMLSSKPHQGKMDWEAYGYARKKTKKQYYEAITVGGELRSHNLNGKLEMDSTKIDPPTGWKGISGSAIFTGAFLRGIIVEMDSAHPTRLEGMTLAKLIADAENDNKLSKTLGFSNQQENDAFDPVNNLLRKSDQALFKVVSKALKINFDNEQTLCDYLISIPIARLVREIADIQTAYSRYNELLGELLQALLPHYTDSGSANIIQHSIGDREAPLIVIPYSSPISAEMLMAKVDKRQLAITEYTKDSFQAKYSLPLPPESADNDQSVEHIASDCYALFGGESHQMKAQRITHHLYDEVIEKSTIEGDISAEEKLEYVKEELEDREEDQEPSYYLLLNTTLFADDLEKNHFVRALKKHFPQFVVLAYSNSPSHRQEERRNYRKLREVLMH